MSIATRSKRLALEKREVEEQLRPAARARKVVAECSRVQARASDEGQMLRDMCRIVVESGGYQLAWIGRVEHDPEKTIRPAASAGDDSEYLESVRISRGASESGQEPAGIAVRSRKPQSVRHLDADPHFSTWRREAVARGYRSVAALPLVAGEEVIGVLGILSAEPDAFDSGELALLEELAHDISYGLGNLRLRAGQHRAEQLLRLEHTVTRCLAEADSVGDAMKTVMRAVCETQGWHCGRYFRVDEPAGLLRFDEAWGIPSAGIEKFIERSRPVTYAAGAGLLGRVWQSGEPLWIADTSQDERAVRAAYAAESGFRGAFLFPVASDGKTIGVLSFSSREIRAPDERLLQAVRVIGSQIGQFLQRKQAEAVRRESEARFRSLTTLSSDWYWEQDDEYRFVDMTSEIDRRTSVSGLSHIGKRRWELAAPNMTEADWAAHRAVVEAHQPFHDLELCRLAEDGSLHWVTISGEPIFDTEGKFEGYRGIGKHITARKREERLLAMEHAVTRRLAEAESLSTGLKAVLRAICESEDWECGRYLRVDETAGVMRFSEYWCRPDRTVEQFIAGKREAVYGPGDGLAGRVWQSGQPLWSADTTIDERGFGSAVNLATGMHGAFVFPVTAEGKTIGVFAFNSREVRDPDERLLRAVHAIGSQIGQYLQRKQAEAVLRESEARFRSLTTLSSDWYWEQDDEYRFVDRTSEIDPKTGVSALAQIGKRLWELSAPNMTEEDWAAHRAVVEAHQPFRNLELCRYTGATPAWVTIDGEPIFDAVGNFKGYRGIGRDITARKRDERLLALEHTVTRRLAEADTASAGLTAVIRAICKTEGWDCGRYFRVDEVACVLRFEEAWGVPGAGIEKFIERSRAVTYAAGAGLVGRVWQSGEPLWIADLSLDDRVLRSAYTAESGVRGAFLFPVKSEGKTFGVLSFSSREIREPEERLLRAVRVIGSQIGQFLHRKDAEAVLRDSEARFRSLTTLSSDWYWEQDDEYRFVDMTSESNRMTGVSARAHIGRRHWELAAPNMTDADWAAHRAVVEAHQPFHDLELCPLADDGSTRWVSISGEPIFDAEGRFKGYRGIGKDINEPKLAARRQAMEHAVTRALAESSTVDAAMPQLIRIICETLGWACGAHWQWDETAELLRCVDTWHINAEGVSEFAAASRDNTNEAPAWRGGSPPGTRTSGLVRGVWFSGAPVWLPDVTQQQGFRRGLVAAKAGLHCAFGFPILAAEQPLGVMEFYGRDIKEPDEALLQIVRAIGSQIGQFLQRKNAEAVLRESEARFRSLTTLSSDWYWEQDAEFRFVEMTSEIDRMTGVSALAHIDKRRWEIAAPNMTEADWAEHRAVVEAHQPYHDRELCRRAEDGSLHWVSVSGEPIFDTDGRFKGYRGIGKDITARKREEKLLALEHAVTRSLAEADSAPTGLRAVMRAICESEGWECGRYLRVDEAAEVLRFSEFWSRSDPMLDQFIAGKRETVYGSGVGLVGKVWQSGQPLWATDTTRDERGLRAAVNVEAGMRGAFHFPVNSEGKTIGVLAFNSREVRDPDERLLRAVRAIGGQIGQFLQRKEADEKVRDQALQQRLIAEFGQQALASADVAEVLNRAAELVSDTLKVDFSNVLQLAPDERSLTYKAAVGWPREWVERRVVPVDPGSRLERILSRKEPLIIEDYSAETEFSASRLLALGVHSGVQVPIFGPKGVFGVLSVHTLRVRRFTEEDLSFLRSVANILAIAIERKNAEDKLAHLAQFDAVTGLPNRYLLRDRLGQALTQAQRNNQVGAVLFVDLDRFKAVNDTFGHGVGDKLLNAVAGRLKNCVRSGDTVARLSGDEFAVVLSNLAKADDAGPVAQKVVDALAAPFALDGHQSYISASVGIALYPGDGNEPDTLLKNADTAMYRAKEQGRNCYRFYLPEMNERVMERMRVESRLRGALDRGEYRLHYQPKVRLDTGVISGFEALLRWEQEGKLVPPLEFISILEDTGLIVPVGEWVLRTACGQIGKWTGMGILPRPVAVNLSARQFQQKNLATTVRQILRETGVAPDLLELELTETLLMSDAEEAVQMLRELKSLGVRLAVDDFGTGYSSLAYLRRFPLDTLKIDRTFIRDAVSNPDDAILTLAIINLAHSMRLKVVAEGVETLGQLNYLRLHGCDEMQGYYFARPLEADDCTQALIEDRRLQLPEAQPTDGLPALLLVDDNEDDLALMRRALASDGFHILTANCAAAGFEALARHGAAIVISDYHLPGMGGIEFLTNVRKLYPDAVRVVTIGGDDTPTLTGAINRAGIHKFLSKNWDPGRLRAEVRDAYRQRVVCRVSGDG